MSYRTIVFLTCVVVCSASGMAQEAENSTGPKGILDIVPAEAPAAIAIRDIVDLTIRGDELIQRTELQVPMRLSDGYRMLLNILRLNRGVDDEGSAALMMMDPESPVETLVLAVPIRDLPAIASNFSIDPDRFTSGNVIDQGKGSRNQYNYVRYLAVQDDHLYLGMHGESVKRASGGKKLRSMLPEDVQTTLSKDDLVLYSNLEHAKDWLNDSIKRARNDSERLGAEDAEALAQLAAAADELKFILSGIRIDRGVAATLLMEFDGIQSQKVLKRLEGNLGRLPMAGFPKGNVVAGHAFQGNGRQSHALSRVLLHHVLHQVTHSSDKAFGQGYQSGIVSVLGEGLRRLRGGGLALYQNQNPRRDGSFSLVAVLHPDDIDTFVDEMTGLAPFINASSLPVDERTGAIDAATIQNLIQQLSDPRFRTRQLASTKLCLIGMPALKHLEEVADTPDEEVRFRVQSISRQIDRAMAADREQILKGDFLANLKPTLTHRAREETVQGIDIDHLQIQLTDGAEEASKQLATLFGADAGHIRLATLDGQVVMFWGSDEELFAQVLQHARDNQVGVDLREVPDAPERNPADQTAIFHFSLAKMAQLMDPRFDPTQPSETPTTISSMGFGVSKRRLRFDLFAPFDEVKAGIQAFR